MVFCKRRSISLRTQVFIAAFISGILPVAMVVIFVFNDFRYLIYSEMEKQLHDLSLWLARDPDVITAYQSDHSTELLKLIGEDVNRNTGAITLFIDKDGTFLYHPNSQLVGLKATDDIAQLLQGRGSFSDIFQSLEAVVYSQRPIRIYDELAGVVIVGFTEPDVSKLLTSIRRTLYLVVPIALFVILVFSSMLSNSIKKRMFNMEPHEIATKLSERSLMLETVKEGIIVVDIDKTITEVNPAARALFGTVEEIKGRKIDEFLTGSAVDQVMATKQPRYDQQVVLGGHLLLANTLPLISGDKVIGGLITFRPLKELNKVAAELTGVNEIIKALRARTHEFSNKLHVISGLLKLKRYDEVEKYLAAISQKEEITVGNIIDNIKIFTVAGLLVGRLSEAEEKNIHFQVDPESSLDYLPPHFDEHAMVVVLGNLIENAFDAVIEREMAIVHVLIKQDDNHIFIEVSDNGTGIDPEFQPFIFEEGFTTKPHGNGFGLANVKKRVDIAGGEITVESSKYGTTFLVDIPCPSTHRELAGDAYELHYSVHR